MLVCLGFLIAGFLLKDYLFGAVSGMLFMVLGVFVATQGLIGFNNFLTQSLAVVFIGVGAYVFIRGGVEAIRGGD